MKKILMLSAIILVSALGYSQVSVNFSVDPTSFIRNNRFNIFSDKLSLVSINQTDYEMQKNENDSIYTVSIDNLKPGSKIVYEFVVSGLHSIISLKRTYIVPDTKSTISAIMDEDLSWFKTYEKLTSARVFDKSDFMVQNYPNPFKKSTEINYLIPQDGRVSVMIYNISGELILNLVNERQIKGMHQIEFDASDLPEGLYFCKITSGKFSSTQKMFHVN